MTFFTRSFVITLLYFVTACNPSGKEGAGGGAGAAAGGVSTTSNELVATVSRAEAQPELADKYPVSFKVQFSQSINPFSLSPDDIEQKGTASGVQWEVKSTPQSSKDNTYYLQAVSVQTPGTIIPVISKGRVQTTNGKTNPESSNLDGNNLVVDFDDLPLMARISRVSAQQETVAQFPIVYQANFNRPLKDSQRLATSVQQSGTASNVQWSVEHVADQKTYLLKAMSAGSSGTIIPSIPANVVTDFRDKSNLASMMSSSNVSLDIQPLDVSIQQEVGQLDPVAQLPIKFRVSFNKAIQVSSFSSDDIVQQGSASVGQWQISSLGDGKNFVLMATQVSTSGTVIPNIPAAKVLDMMSQPNTAATGMDRQVTYDKVQPAVLVEKALDQPALTSTLPVKFTATFNKAIDTLSFVASDIANIGTASGVQWEIIPIGTDKKVFTLQVKAVSIPGSVLPSLGAGVLQDSLGNLNAASGNFASQAVTIDNSPISVSIRRGTNQSTSTETLPISFQLQFGKFINPTTLTPSDIRQVGTAQGVEWSIQPSGDNKNYVIQAVNVTSSGTILPIIDAGMVRDTLGNSNLAANNFNESVSLSEAPLTAAFDVADGQQLLVRLFPVSFKVSFSKPIVSSTFSSSDISNKGTATGVTWNLSRIDDRNYNVTAQGTSSGTVLPSIGAALVRDRFNNANSESFYRPASPVKVDSSPVGVSIAQNILQADPAGVGPVRFKVSFSKAIDTQSFTSSDIQNLGTVQSVVWSVEGNEEAKIFDIVANSIQGSGTIRPSIAAGVVSDSLGNANTVSVSGEDNVVTIDQSPLQVVIAKAENQAAQTSQDGVEFLLTFSKSINLETFTPADVSSAGTLSVATWTISEVPGSQQKIFKLSASGLNGAGTVIPAIAQGLVEDGLRNHNNVATYAANSTVQFNNQPLNVVISKAAAQKSPVNAGPVFFDVKFDRKINPQTFTVADIQQAGTLNASLNWNIQATSDETKYILSIADLQVNGSGSIQPQILAGSIQDAFANTNRASTGVDDIVQYDRRSFGIAIARAAEQPQSTKNSSIKFLIRFSTEPNIETFSKSFVRCDGCGDSFSEISFEPVVPNVYRDLHLYVTPTQGGVIKPTIAAGLISDSIGNKNSASTINVDQTVQYNLPFPIVVQQAAEQSDPAQSFPIRFIASSPNGNLISVSSLSDDIVMNAGTATDVVFAVDKSSFSSTTCVREFPILVNSVKNPGTIIPRIIGSRIADCQLNSNLDSTDGTDNVVTYRLPPLKVVVAKHTNQVNPALSLPIAFTVDFERDLQAGSFQADDIINGGTATGVVWSVSSISAKQYKVEATSFTNRGTFLPSVKVASVLDTFGFSNAASTAESGSEVSLENSPITVLISLADAQSSSVDSLPARFKVSLGKVIDPQSFSIADVRQAGRATGVVWRLMPIDNKTYSLDAVSATSGGSINPVIDAGKISDLLKNSNSASNLEASIQLTELPLTVKIEKTADQPEYANTAPIRYTATVSRAFSSSTLAPTDITQAGTARDVVWSISPIGATTFSITATAVGSAGSVIPSLAAGVISDQYSNTNSASFVQGAFVKYDNTQVVPTISQLSTQVDPVSTTSAKFKVDFNKAIQPSTLTASDLKNAGSYTGPVTWAIEASTLTTSSSSSSFVVTASGFSGNGTLQPKLEASSVSDQWGNPNAASLDGADNTITIDQLPMSVVIGKDATQSSVTSVDGVKFRAKFSKPVKVSSFTAADVKNANAFAVPVWNVQATQDPQEFVLVAQGMTGSGQIQPAIDAGLVEDQLGNKNTASQASSDALVMFNNEPLSVVITKEASTASPTRNSPIAFTATFNKAVADGTFTASDVQQSGTLSGSITWSVSTTSSPTVYSIQALNLGSGSGTVQPSIPARMLTDRFGNQNGASTFSGSPVNYDKGDIAGAIVLAAGQSTSTNVSPIKYSLVLTKPIDPATLTGDDFACSAACTAALSKVEVSPTSDARIYNLSVYPSKGGKVSLAVAAGKFADALGNQNLSTTATSDAIVIFNLPFDLSISQLSTQVDPAQSLPIKFRVFATDGRQLKMPSLVAGKITNIGSATGLTWGVDLITTECVSEIVINVNSISQAGSITPVLLDGGVADCSGNTSKISVGAGDNTVTYTYPPFGVTIAQGAGQADPTSAVPIQFTVSFASAIDVASFATTDISNIGTSAGVSWNILTSSDSKEFTIQATGVQISGTVIPSISAGAVRSASGALNSLSRTVSDSSVQYIKPGTWQTLGKMSVPRSSFAWASLDSNRILLAGGYGQAGNLAGTEIINLSTGQSVVATSLKQARKHSTAQLMSNGKVLIASAAGTGTMVEVFDPSTNSGLGSTQLYSFALQGSQSNFTSVALTGGQILTAAYGGLDLIDPRNMSHALKLPAAFGTELKSAYDQSSNSVYLNSSSTVYKFNGSTGALTRVGNLSTSRIAATITVLPDKRLLFTGGHQGTSALNTAEILNPVTGVTTPVGSMSTIRFRHEAVLLKNGKVLVMGGQAWGSVNNTTEIFDPATNKFTPGPTMNQARYMFAAFSTSDGRVFAVGGDGNGGAPWPDTIEVLNP